MVKMACKQGDEFVYFNSILYKSHQSLDLAQHPSNSTTSSLATAQTSPPLRQPWEQFVQTNIAIWVLTSTSAVFLLLRLYCRLYCRLRFSGFLCAVAKVLQALAEAGLYLRYEKCEYQSCPR